MMLLRAAFVSLALATLSNAFPVPAYIQPTRTYLARREVPQEHSHEPILVATRNALNLNNPAGIQDPVFGLLGNAAAVKGANGIDPDCLQQAAADQAFTNAKTAGDVAAMTAALQFRALERNTGKVGLASVPCTAVKAVNPEIAAIAPHQDPASANAASVNKAIVIELAKQIAAIGGDPQDALITGTFAPASTSDLTGKGNSCDDANDPQGCIFTQNLIVTDATPAEIEAAVAGAGQESQDQASDSQGTCQASSANSASGAVASSGNVPGTNAKSPSGPDATAAASPLSGNAGNDEQTFIGSLGGIKAPAVTRGGRGFVVDGSDFINSSAAVQRSCSVQHNQCANAANSGEGFSVADCDSQLDDCNAGIQ